MRPPQKEFQPIVQIGRMSEKKRDIHCIAYVYAAVVLGWKPG